MDEQIDYYTEFGITKDWLIRLFPFYLILDEYLGVKDFGPLILKAVKEIEMDQSIDNFFEYDTEEDKDITPENLVNYQNKLLSLVGKMSPLKLAGEVRFYPDKKVFLILCGPRLTKKNQITRYGISVEDLPLSDPTRNFINIVD